MWVWRFALFCRLLWSCNIFTSRVCCCILPCKTQNGNTHTSWLKMTFLSPEVTFTSQTISGHVNSPSQKGHFRRLPTRQTHPVLNPFGHWRSHPQPACYGGSSLGIPTLCGTCRWSGGADNLGYDCSYSFGVDVGGGYIYIYYDLLAYRHPNNWWVGVWTPKHLLTRLLKVPNTYSPGIWKILDVQWR